MIAKYLIDESIPYFKSSDTVDFALELMQEYKVEHLPIIQGKKVIGLVSESMLLNYSEQGKKLQDIPYNAKPVFVLQDDHLFNVLRQFKKHEQTTIPVLDTEQEYVGLISLKSAMQSLLTFNLASEPGSIFTLEIDVNDYSLSEIARLVEANNAVVLSIATHKLESIGTMAVTIKVNASDLTHIIATFERFDYKIIQAFYQSEQMDYLKERYDSFMHYLNI